MRILLALDVGNTGVSVALFKGSRFFHKGWMPTDGPRSYESLLRRFLPSRPAVSEVILSSVVPQATHLLKKTLRKMGLPAPGVLGENIQAPVINRYRIPSQVGQDRLVNAAAAYEWYGGPAVIVDFGTAVTLDLVSRRREYLGGFIVPGLEVALAALAERTALLPKVGLKRPKEFLGRDTRSSILSGLFHGYGAMCDGLVTRMRARYAPRARVVATGGHARLMAPFCRTLQVVNPDLTLQGLELTSRLVKKSC